SFAIDPANSKKLYAVISIETVIGFYTSVDGGIKWSKEKNLDDKIKNIYIHPTSPGNDRTIYLAGTNSVQVRERGNWKINKGPAGVKKLTEFTGGYDKRQDKYITYAMSGKSYFNPNDDLSCIYYSSNG